jgi:hypothetical protein
VFTRRADTIFMAAAAPSSAGSTRRPAPTRPLRRAFGLLVGLAAAADFAVATAIEGNPLGIPPVPAEAQTGMLVYGGVLIAVALWAVLTSFGHRHTTATTAARKATSTSSSAAPGTATAAAPSRTATPATPTPASPAGDGDERHVVHALRHEGWYVADDIVLPHVDVDHIAIGPAGVLAIQTQWTDRPDARGKPAARARIAAHQLRQALAVRELDVEVVPAVLTFGPGLTDEPGGVRVVDAVAMLNGYQSDEWIAQLTSRALIAEPIVDAVRTLVADLREGHIAPATSPRQLELVR